jgi:hypothetical protein
VVELFNVSVTVVVEALGLLAAVVIEWLGVGL